MTIVAGIVAFNPDEERLRENLSAVFIHVERVLIVDNASNDQSLLDQLAADFAGLSVVRNDANLGIASALNQIAEWAIGQGAEWALFLDQDSVCSPGMVPALTRNVGDGIALIVPAILDRNLPRPVTDARGVQDVSYAITSGALANLGVWQSVGGYDDALFIDFVDFDYCVRVRTEGHRIVRDFEAVLLHEIGQSRRHGRVIAYNHSAFRSYHMSRDMIHYARKHRGTPKAFKVNGRGLFGTYLVLFRKAIIVAVHEEDRFNRVLALLRGITAETFGRPRRVG